MGLNQYVSYLTKVATFFLLVIYSVIGQSATLIKNATILTLAKGEDEAFSGYMVIEDDHIRVLGEGPFDPRQHQSITVENTVDVEGKIILPSFVSGHNHLWQSVFRGIAADSELVAWLQALHWTYGDYVGKGDFYNFTLHGALDQLSHGVTTTYNHAHRLGASEAHYLETIDAEMAAGQRFIFSYNSDLSKSPKEIRQAVANVVKLAKAQQKPGSPFLALSMNVVGGFRGGEKFALEVELAKKYNLTSQLHYLEQYSRRFSDYRHWPEFKAVGAVNDKISYAHFIHPTDNILREAAEKGVAMIWNPLSNGRLASGLADIPKYLDIGLKVGMGVDGAASGDISDPFENMRLGLYALRMHYKTATVMMPIDILRLHTLGTAEALGFEQAIGSLAPGKKADFIVLDLNKPATGAIFDLPANIVFSASASNIAAVYVGGEKLVEYGQLLRHDMTARQAEAITRVQRIRQAAGE